MRKAREHFETRREVPTSRAWPVANPVLAATLPMGPLLGTADAGPFLTDHSLAAAHGQTEYDDDENDMAKPCPREMIVGTQWEHDFVPLRGPLPSPCRPSK